MNDKFEKAIAFVLEHEGGYVNDPRDPGGETKYGISKRAYPTLDIKNLTEETAKALYYKDYWIKAGCADLDFPMCLAHIDTAVNMGVGAASALLNKTTDFQEYLQLRIARYLDIIKKNPSLGVYKKGWLNRVNDLKKYAEINVEA